MLITSLNNGITLATFLLSGIIPVSNDLLIIGADPNGIRIKFMDVFNILYKNYIAALTGSLTYL